MRELIIENESRRRHDMSTLLNDDHISFYWIGFILADAYICPDKARLKLHLSDTEKYHQDKFARLLSYDTNNKEVNLQNKFYVPLICNKFNINSRKTYNPPDYKKYTFDRELILSMLVGIFDGDGCLVINQKGYIGGRIVCHSSWLNFFYDIHKDISIMNEPYIDKRGYMYSSISNKDMKVMKSHISKHNIPALERKWSRVI